jgi:aryl-alcohol dehydrogenase-like predicted oxidoreductase
LVARTLKLGEAEIARIGLGTNRLTDTAENVDFVREAVAAGVNLIDTAHVYAGGNSEATIGKASVPEGCVVATKGGYAAGTGRPEALRAQIEESLRRLRTDSIGLYYLHRIDPETPLEESLGEIKAHRDAGKIRHVGVSAVGVEQVERARQIVPIAAVQNHYNLSERESEDVIDYCAEHRIAFVPYFPLRGRGGRALKKIAKRRGAAHAQVTLAWLLRRSPVVAPIPGTLSLEHLRQNLDALEIELTDAEYDALR